MGEHSQIHDNVSKIHYKNQILHSFTLINWCQKNILKTEHETVKIKCWHVSILPLFLRQICLTTYNLSMFNTTEVTTKWSPRPFSPCGLGPTKNACKLTACWNRCVSVWSVHMLPCWPFAGLLCHDHTEGCDDSHRKSMHKCKYTNIFTKINMRMLWTPLIGMWRKNNAGVNAFF